MFHMNNNMIRGSNECYLFPRSLFLWAFSGHETNYNMVLSSAFVCSQLS